MGAKATVASNSREPSVRAGDGTLFAIAVGLLVFSILAFSLKATFNPERLVRYTPIVIVHGIVMLAWLVLFASQARFAMTGKLQRHRTFGMASLLLVLVMVPLGIHVSWQFGQETGRMIVFVGNAINFLQFVPLYATAIIAAKRHRFEDHKRLMLVASIALTGPAVGRVIEVADLPLPVTMLAFLLAIIVLPLAYDIRVRRKPHRASVMAIGYVILTIGIFGAYAASLPSS
ncbi:hypothetical protein [Aurantiacibacter gilvus]|uniref:DUF2306 domain-containing protein n=1 Tax=Aurantiacibacter gilvus TaxID=3139141 RepID=A0ABU9IF46_9SPHN